jgi:ABC-type uncharacterized transport system ATPase subunit
LTPGNSSYIIDEAICMCISEEAHKLSKELLRLENISKSFPGVRALHNISFNVNSGEIH